MPIWLRAWLMLAGVAAIALLLLIGFAFTVVAVSFALVPLWLWSYFSGRLSRRGPVVIEGEYRVTHTAEPDAASAAEHDDGGQLDRSSRRR